MTQARLSFGERVTVVSDLLNGRITRDEARSRLDVTDDRLDDLVHEHARDRPISLDEFRQKKIATAEHRDLHARVAKLNAVLQASERTLILLRQLARARGLL